jgi:hypothetical protein
VRAAIVRAHVPPESVVIEELADFVAGSAHVVVDIAYAAATSPPC